MLTKRHMLRVLKLQRSYGENPHDGFCHQNTAVSGPTRRIGKPKSKFTVRIEPKAPK
jgi:hypothetical protein